MIAAQLYLFSVVACNFIINMLSNKEQQGKQEKKEVVYREDEKGNRIFVFPNFQDYPFEVNADYQLESIKGWGTYSLVAAGHSTITNQPMAVKRVNKIFDNLGDAKRILRQIKILKFLKHKNIIGLKDIIPIPEETKHTFNEVYLCMEYMDYTLKRLIHSQQVPLTEKMIQFILYQLLSAVSYMHSADIIHRDMKPENILINKKLELKIADMNLARKENNEEVTYYVTSRPYRAPEVFVNGSVYTKVIDIWSIGCILAEMLGKTVLFQGSDYVGQITRFVAILGKPKLQVFENIDSITAQGLSRVFKDIPNREKVKWRQLFSKASDQVLDLLDHMLVYDPKSRYTAEQCLNHPFLEDFRYRPRSGCKEIFDFSFDQIEMTMPNLRNAIYEQVQNFQREKLRRPEIPEGMQGGGKKVKRE